MLPKLYRYFRELKNLFMKPDLTNIKNIIFDLGRVLLNLDFNATIEAFSTLGFSGNVLDQALAYKDPVFYELETGKITPRQFCDRVREILNNKNLSDLQIEDAWYAMIKDIPAERVETLKRLSGNYNVYLFSNTNQIHIERLHQKFRTDFGIEFSSLFVKDFYSHEIHLGKPDVNSYLKVIEISGVNPEETLFVDDLEKNIEGAQKAGLKTFWHKEGFEMATIF